MALVQALLSYSRATKLFRLQQKGNLKQKVEKYNKRIIEAVQSWIQQLRTPVRDSYFHIAHVLSNVACILYVKEERSEAERV